MSVDCISREAVIDALEKVADLFPWRVPDSYNGAWNDAIGRAEMEIEVLPAVRPKVDVDALINKIETEMSWDMFDEWGNSTDLHNQLVGIIREFFGEVSE